MEHIKLLIVDDVEDNRLVLRAICRKIEGLELFEAVDGQDAVEKCETLHPHIVLMDVMMPRLDGFQASKIIKERYPDTVVMAVTAVIDPKMEENMNTIGVAAYIRKPIDKELLRLKIQSYAGALSISGRETKMLSKKGSLNPFCDEVRHFKTIFEIQNAEAVMDFGVWLLGRFECAHANVCANIDMIIEILYSLIHKEIKSESSVMITIEESFDEMFIYVPLLNSIEKNPTIDHLIHQLGNMCMIMPKAAAFRIPFSTMVQVYATPVVKRQSVELPSEPVSKRSEIAETEVETRSIGVMENRVLRESFVYKITAKEYVESIDSDAYGEVSDLREAEEEWTHWLDVLRENGSEENFQNFANGVLRVYADAISALYEFSGLSYAMVSLTALISANAALLVEDAEKRANTLLFLNGFKNDLSSWIEHIFELQDAQDIHYLDGSFFSSCMIIESILTGTVIDSGEEGEIEFF